MKKTSFVENNAGCSQETSFRGGLPPTVSLNKSESTVQCMGSATRHTKEASKDE